MPTTMDSTFAEIFIAFAMIGLLGLILRFTFGRELRQPPDANALPGPSDDRDLDLGVSEPPPGPAVSALMPALAPDEDFGLLAPVAVTDTPEQARRVRELLAEAGIRATTTVGRDGRHRVLVFATELDRARRVDGWSA